MALHVLGEGGDDGFARVEEEFPDRAAGSIARAHAVRGAVDEAFDWLERVDRIRDPELTRGLPDPLIDGLRDDPRWNAMQLGLDLGS